MFTLTSKKIQQKRFFTCFGQYVIKSCRLIFSVSVSTFIVYFILENFKTGLISNYFDLNCLLAVSIICGPVIIIFGKKDKSSHAKSGHLWIFILLALAAGLLCYQYLQNFEKMRYYIPPLVMISLVAIGFLSRRSDDEDE